jgi:hypothetical protein
VTYISSSKHFFTCELQLVASSRNLLLKFLREMEVKSATTPQSFEFVASLGNARMTTTPVPRS